MVQYSQKFDDLETVDQWGLQVLKWQRLKTHDLFQIMRDDSGVTTVTCTCGLVLDLPDVLSEKYPIGMSSFPFGFDVRQIVRDFDLEDWFYRQVGHRDVAFGHDHRVFIALFASGTQTPHRKIWCAACDAFQAFYSGGGTHLYRPGAHTEQVEKHLAQCASIVREDRLREWSRLMWRAAKSAKPGTRIFGRPPRAHNGVATQASDDTKDSGNN